MPTPPLGQPAAFNASASDPLSETIGALPATTTTLNASSAASVTGQQVTYTATVASSDGGGSVSFTDLGSRSPAARGSHSPVVRRCARRPMPTPRPTVLGAAYSGDGAAAEASVSADLPHSVSLAAPTTAPTVAVNNLGNGAATVAITAPPVPVAVRQATAGSAVTGYNLYQGTAAGKESATPVNPSRILARAEGLHGPRPEDRDEVFLRHAGAECRRCRSEIHGGVRDTRDGTIGPARRGRPRRQPSLSPSAGRRRCRAAAARSRATTSTSGQWRAEESPRQRQTPRCCRQQHAGSPCHGWSTGRSISSGSRR